MQDQSEDSEAINDAIDDFTAQHGETAALELLARSLVLKLAKQGFAGVTIGIYGAGAIDVCMTRSESRVGPTWH